MSRRSRPADGTQRLVQDFADLLDGVQSAASTTQLLPWISESFSLTFRVTSLVAAGTVVAAIDTLTDGSTFPALCSCLARSLHLCFTAVAPLRLGAGARVPDVNKAALVMPHNLATCVKALCSYAVTHKELGIEDSLVAAVDRSGEKYC